MVEININPPVGYEVDEIYYVIEGSDEKIVIQNSSFKMPPNHISIFINLKETKYTINYSLDGGEFDNTPISYYTVNTPTFNLPAPTKEGYIFLGWTDKDLIDPTLSYTVSQGSTKNISVEANWEIAKYNVTVEIIGEGSIDTASLVEYNHEQYYDMSMSDGWRLAEIYYIKAGDTEKVMMGADIFIMPASDITIYAVFEKIYQ